ncbi:hypothetical protein QUF76_05645 [Desulfobacterales bacterium HSG16]|nr:hypothetical protein [Desulfobacterales bacterium HSG16]
MVSRHEKIGMKQVIRIEWMNKVTSMLLSDMPEAGIRQELDEYLSTQKPSGGQGTRGKITYKMAIGILSSWFSPDQELVDFRNDALKLARKLPEDKWLPLHWAVISAQYPFWFNAAKQVGRLLNLQEKITQKQIFNRLKAQYGDRETVARNARYAIRSFVAWGVIKDSSRRGCYEKGEIFSIEDREMITTLLEGGLLAAEEGKGYASVLFNSPGFFPFDMLTMTGAVIAQHSSRIDVVRFGIDDELLKLKHKD